MSFFSLGALKQGRERACIIGLLLTLATGTAGAYAQTTFTAPGLPIPIPDSAAGTPEAFANFNAQVSGVNNAGVTVNVTDSRPGDMKIVVSDDNGDQFVMWDHEQLVDSNKQLITDVVATVKLPDAFVQFLNDPQSDHIISVRVVDDTDVPPDNGTAGTFNSCTLTINATNLNHAAPGTQFFLNGVLEPNSVPTIGIAAGTPISLLAKASAASGFSVARLGLIVTRVRPAPNPNPCPAGGCGGDLTGLGPQWDSTPGTILPPTFDAFRRSVEVRQTSATTPSPSVTFAAPELPDLLPGEYQVSIAAYDNSGLATITPVATLIVTRNLGFFAVTNLTTVNNGPPFPGTTEQSTVNVTATLQVEDRQPAGTSPTSSLRVVLLARPLPIFFRGIMSAPASLPAPVTLGTVNLAALGPGGHRDVPISAVIPGPITNNAGNSAGVQWELDAILQEAFGSNFISIDDIAVALGQKPLVNGPDNAKLNPDPGVDAQHTTKELSFVEIRGPTSAPGLPPDSLTVFSGGPPVQYHLTAILQPFGTATQDSADETAAAVWKLNGQPLPGGVLHPPNVTAPTLMTLSASFSFGLVTKTVSQLITVQPAHAAVPPSLLRNISTRLQVGTVPNDTAQLGFIIKGTAPKKVFVRGLGPTLTHYGVAGALNDPVLQLHDLTTGTITKNDDWESTIIGGLITQPIATQIQWAKTAEGLPLVPPAPVPPYQPPSRESALIVTLAPNHNYSAVLSGWNSTAGIGIVEIYDLSPSSSSYIYNVSTRGITSAVAPKILDAGVIVPNPGAQVLVRALGPTMTKYGVTGVVRDPVLSLHNANGTVIAANDNWQTDPFASKIPVAFHPPYPVESALIRTLPASKYTAVVSGKDGTTPEVGLVEVYNLQQ